MKKNGMGNYIKMKLMKKYKSCGCEGNTEYNKNGNEKLKSFNKNE